MDDFFKKYQKIARKNQSKATFIEPSKSGWMQTIKDTISEYLPKTDYEVYEETGIDRAKRRTTLQDLIYKAANPREWELFKPKRQKLYELEQDLINELKLKPKQATKIAIEASTPRYKKINTDTDEQPEYIKDYLRARGIIKGAEMAMDMPVPAAKVVKIYETPKYLIDKFGKAKADTLVNILNETSIKRLIGKVEPNRLAEKLLGKNAPKDLKDYLARYIDTLRRTKEDIVNKGYQVGYRAEDTTYDAYGNIRSNEYAEYLTDAELLEGKNEKQLIRSVQGISSLPRSRVDIIRRAEDGGVEFDAYGPMTPEQARNFLAIYRYKNEGADKPAWLSVLEEKGVDADELMYMLKNGSKSASELIRQAKVFGKVNEGTLRAMKTARIRHTATQYDDIRQGMTDGQTKELRSEINRDISKYVDKELEDIGMVDDMNKNTQKHANLGLTEEEFKRALDFESGTDFAENFGDRVLDIMRENGFNYLHEVADWWNKNIKPIKDKMPKLLDTLNPTGGVGTSIKYDPESRVRLPIDTNKLTTLDVTMGKNPDDVITIYRGAPKHQKEIVPGDYVTDLYDLAKSYAGYGGHVLEKKVRLGDILDDIEDSLGNEYIYRPGADKEISKLKRNKNANYLLMISAPEAVNEIVNNEDKKPEVKYTEQKTPITIKDLLNSMAYVESSGGKFRVGDNGNSKGIFHRNDAYGNYTKGKELFRQRYGYYPKTDQDRYEAQRMFLRWFEQEAYPSKPANTIKELLLRYNTDTANMGENGIKYINQIKSYLKSLGYSDKDINKLLKEKYTDFIRQKNNVIFAKWYKDMQRNKLGNK